MKDCLKRKPCADQLWPTFCFEWGVLFCYLFSGWYFWICLGNIYGCKGSLFWHIAISSSGRFRLGFRGEKGNIFICLVTRIYIISPIPKPLTTELSARGVNVFGFREKWLSPQSVINAEWFVKLEQLFKVNIMNFLWSNWHSIIMIIEGNAQPCNAMFNLSPEDDCLAWLFFLFLKELKAIDPRACEVIP